MTSLIKNKISIYAIPFVIGLLTSYSLPPYGFFFINFITLPVLFFYLLNNYENGKWTSFKIGWMFGFGYFISNLYWISNSLTFEEIFKPLIRNFQIINFRDILPDAIVSINSIILKYSQGKICCYGFCH